MTNTITPMTADEFSARLRALQNEFHTQVVSLVHEAQNSNGLDTNTDEALPFADDTRIDDATSDIVCMGGWIMDRINGINRLHRKSLTKKLRRVLGYTYP